MANHVWTAFVEQMTPPFRYFEVLTVPRVTNNPPPLAYQASRPADRSRASGFTTVELMTVVGILVLLATIAVIGFKFVGDRAKGNSVRVTLETLKSLTQEAETAGLFRRSPTRVWGNDDTAGTNPLNMRSYSTTFPFLSGRIVPDLWRRTDPTAPPPLPPPAPESALNSLWSPGVVKPDVYRQGFFDGFNYGGRDPADVNAQTAPQPERMNWRVAPAIRNTTLAVAMLRTVPAVKSTLDSLPGSGSTYAAFWASTNAYPRGSRVIYDPIDSSNPANATAASFDGPNVYLARRDVTAGNRPTPGTDTADWERSHTAILDGFGNPIIFVLSAGLHFGERYQATRSYEVGERVFFGNGTGRVYYECIAPVSPNPPPAPPLTNTSFWRVATPVRSPDGRPFWASAGADGNFDTPADNLYSFEN